MGPFCNCLKKLARNNKFILVGHHVTALYIRKMTRSTPRLALQESLPIGYMAARLKMIHDTGCRAGGGGGGNIPDELINKKDAIREYYKAKGGKKSKKSKKIMKGGCGCSATPTVEGMMSGGGAPAQHGGGCGCGAKPTVDTVMSGGGGLVAATTTADLATVLVLLGLNELNRYYKGYKKGIISGGADKKAINSLKKLPKSTLKNLVNGIMNTSPPAPNTVVGKQVSKLLGVKLTTTGGGDKKNGDDAKVLGDLLSQLKELLEHKKQQTGGGCGCGLGKKSVKEMLAELTMTGGGFSNVYNQGIAGCSQPDWCANCI